MSPTYRFYSIGQAPATSARAGAWIVLGWSRTQAAAEGRPGTAYWVHAGSRPQAARIARDRFGIELDTRHRPGGG